MQDTMSLLMATAILAAGGLGLYMYKNSDETQENEDKYDEDSLFGSNNFWNVNNGENNSDDEENDYYEPKVKARGGKTKRNRKGVGTKRRY